jgi:hypothetical protein
MDDSGSVANWQDPSWVPLSSGRNWSNLSQVFYPWASTKVQAPAVNGMDQAAVVIKF